MGIHNCIPLNSEPLDNGRLAQRAGGGVTARYLIHCACLLIYYLPTLPRGVSPINGGSKILLFRSLFVVANFVTLRSNLIHFYVTGWMTDEFHAWLKGDLS